ncbi:MAG: acetate--CoA ligase family protein [Pseudomonadota bacterium]
MKKKKSARRDSLDGLFRPRTIAVIGASKRKGQIGREILRNIVTFEFPGAVYPVNPNADTVLSMRCYPSVLAIQDDIDLAFIVVPRRHVQKVVEECGIKGVKGIVVITAGFKEIGGSGVEAEKRLLETVRRYSMRMVGPNCMGIVNTHPGYRIFGTFAGNPPILGRVGFSSQSGAVGAVLLNYASRVGLGFSMFVSVGNKADVSANDLLEYWETAPSTDAILLYMENFGNPRKFFPLARKITKTKPVVAVKSGRTVQGARAASSHTGALADNEAVTNALFEQTGVLRVDSVRTLFDVAKALTGGYLPMGDRIGIVTNAGGPGILLTDAVIQSGMRLATLKKETVAVLRDKLPKEAAVCNPVDVIASAGAQSYHDALVAVAADPNVDALIAVFVPPIMIEIDDVIKKIIDVRKRTDKPILSCIMGTMEGAEGTIDLNLHGIPNYEFPDRAAYAMAMLVKYADWKSKPEGRTPQFKVNRKKVEDIIGAAAAGGGGWLDAADVRDVFKAYGIDMVPSAGAASPTEAARVAAEVGFPVVMKVLSPDVIHKTDVGGVLVDVRTKGEARAGFRKIQAALKKKVRGAKFEGVEIQTMVKEGRELIVGMHLDPKAGPLLMFGLGGIFAETIKDVVFRICPITDLEANEMLESLRGVAILKGARGEKSVDMDRLKEILLRLSQLVSDFHEIETFDINPLLAMEKGKPTVAVDARIRISPQKGPGLES